MSSKNSSIVEQISEWIQPKLDELSLSLYDISFKKEGSDKYLRIILDKEASGVSISDCEGVSRFLDKILEEKDPIDEAYILEVSSPGVERALKKDSDFVRFAGETVDVKLYKAIDNQKTIRGKLIGLVDNAVTIECDEGTKSFNKDVVAQVKTVFEW
ncbi:MAG: ribosome maturation factor RimP [Defluviitaleaceae bacterium]|nr:ribosome maturation factor RimP [Defluviitaleaceae bacterium]